MTNGNEPTAPGQPGDEETTVVRRPDAAGQQQSPWQRDQQSFAGPTEQIGQPQPGQPQPGHGQPGQEQAGQTQTGWQPGQYGAPSGAPQGGPAYGQQPYAQQGYQQQYGQPQYGQSQFDQSQYGQPQPYAQAPFGQQQPPAPPLGGDPTLNPYAPAQPAPKKATGKLIGVIVGVLVLIAAVVALTAFVWPGWVTKTFNQSAVQDGVMKVLTAKNQDDGYGLSDVKDVQCPSGQEVKAGTVFTCSVKVKGENKHVTVTVKDDKGTYEVSRPTN